MKAIPLHRGNLRRSIIVQGGANNNYRGYPCGPDSGLGGPGGDVFSLSSSSDLPLFLLRLKLSPGPPRPLQESPGHPPYSLLALSLRLLTVSKFLYGQKLIVLNRLFICIYVYVNILLCFYILVFDLPWSM